ncbi:hypothetical protein SNEBB_010444 [Seison nebaliae]|nr:hypothetical protein SNEBB_010444 [Seison nebaliae]
MSKLPNVGAMEFQHIHDILDRSTIYEICTFYMPILMVLTGSICFIVLFFVAAPYGRYVNKKLGPTINGKLAWCLQECPSFFIPIFCLIGFSLEFSEYHANFYETLNKPKTIILSLFTFHYFYRSFIYPRLIEKCKRMSIIIMMLAGTFSIFNGTMQAITNTIHEYEHNHQFHAYHKNDSFTPPFFLGIIIFIIGFLINMHSDILLIKLRSKSSKTTYSIPTGGLFKYVSCANYFGECIEWTGYAIASQTFPAIAFCFFTWANLLPRAVAHHRWYKEKFRESYPSKRKCLIPFLI